MNNAKEAAQYLNGYIEDQLIKLAEVVKENPCDIKTQVAADLLGVSIESMRTYLKNGGDLGIAWKKSGKQNSGMSIPTFQFLLKSYGTGIINVVKEYIK
ncbi:MAG: hypothetical protein NC320_13100 [Clostridium sp.]|nr:hypothetical protein [Clostridium sp.]